MNYEVKNVKSFRGEDCPGFNATLYRDGKKVAFLCDSGNGGELKIEWEDWKAPRVEVPWTTIIGESVTFQCTPEEAIAHESIRGKTWSFNGKDMGQMSLESHLIELVEKFENDKRFKRMCQKETLFRIKGDRDGEWRRIKAVFSQRVKDFIGSKYGTQVESIMNENFGQMAS